MDAVAYSMAKKIPATTPAGHQYEIQLPVRADRQAQVTLSDDRILLGSGYEAGTQFTGWRIYDPVAKTFTAKASDYGLNDPMGLPGKTTDKLVVMDDFYTREYTISTNTWAGLANPDPGSTPAVSVLSNGDYFLSGGYSSALTWRYDIAGGTWTAKANIPDTRWGHSQSTLANGDPLLVGGNSSGVSAIVRTYNQASNTWTDKASFPHNVTYHKQVTLQDGRVLVIGGYIQGYVDNTWTYDFAANAWTQTQNRLNRRKRSYALSMRSDGRVHITGGYDEDIVQSIRDNHIYDPGRSDPAAKRLLAYLATL